MRPSRLVSLAAFLLVAGPAIGGCQTYYPGCPHWSHAVTFTNGSNAPVTFTETDACYSNPMQAPYTGKCWPQQLPGGKLTLAAGASQTVSIISCWSGNFSVACAGCDASIPYQTLAEFTFDGGLANVDPPTKIDSNLDNYDISLVDGFTTALLIQANNASCSVAGCGVQPVCPTKLVYQGGCLSPNTYVRNVMANPTEEDKDKYGCICSSTSQISCTAGAGNTVTPAGCVGKYGCSPFSPPGAASSAGAANPGSACCPWYQQAGQSCSAASAARAWEPWAQEYIANVHAACPNQYAWQYDDNQGGFACPSASAATAYRITVPPAGVPAMKR